MKILAIILTCLLALPVASALYTIFVVMPRYSGTGFNAAMLPLVWTILLNLLFMIVAIILNFNKKYQECSIMCSTLLTYFMASTILNVAGSFLMQWLKLV